MPALSILPGNCRRAGNGVLRCGIAGQRGPQGSAEFLTGESVTWQTGLNHPRKLLRFP